MLYVFSFVCDNLSVQITATIITLNEEAPTSYAAIESVSWADEVIVVDSGSNDDTRDLAASSGARVIENPWPGFSQQKQFAVDAARNEWIFSLDADEHVSEALRHEISAIDLEGSTAKGFRIPRLSTYMGREIRHSGWYPDWQLRLFDRRSGRWNGKMVHESFVLDNRRAAGQVSKSDLA